MRGRREQTNRWWLQRACMLVADITRRETQLRHRLEAAVTTREVRVILPQMCGLVAKLPLSHEAPGPSTAMKVAIASISK